ncbi:MAG TPA: hypothetical protein PK231_05755, partial [Acidocella sp.]|nr:hypothetical protein [Acidocella sp.]
DSLGASLRNGLRPDLRGGLGESLGRSLRDNLRDSLEGGLADSLGASFQDAQIKNRYTNWWGQQDLYWVAFYQFCQEIGIKYDADAADGLDIMHEIGLSCMWWYPYDGLIVACERPLAIRMDERERLHNETGPAVEFRDGWKVYSIHGTRVPEWVITSPNEITIEKIDAEKNTEVQRVMIERFGWDRYADECGAEILDHDERWGTLYGKNNSALFLRVINRSPEPDGSFRNYILPVAPNCAPLPDEGDMEMGEAQALTALNAVASTFGLTGEEYADLVEAES